MAISIVLHLTFKIADRNKELDNSTHLHWWLLSLTRHDDKLLVYHFAEMENGLGQRTEEQKFSNYLANKMNLFMESACLLQSVLTVSRTLALVANAHLLLLPVTSTIKKLCTVRSSIILLKSCPKNRETMNAMLPKNGVVNVHLIMRSLKRLYYHIPIYTTRCQRCEFKYRRTSTSVWGCTIVKYSENFHYISLPGSHWWELVFAVRSVRMVKVCRTSVPKKKKKN